MRGLVLLLMVSVAVLSCHAAAVDRTNDELVDLLDKLQSQLRSRALELEEPRDAKEDKQEEEEVDVEAKAKDEEVEVDITRDEEVEVDITRDEEDINIVRDAESDPQSRQAADAPPSTGSAPATDPRPDIAANVLKLIIDLLDDSLKLLTSLESGSGGSGTRAGKDVRRPDGSEINEETADSEDSSEEGGNGEDSEESEETDDDSEAQLDRPVGNKTARLHRRAVKGVRRPDGEEGEESGAQGGAQGAAGGSDSQGNSTTPPGSPIVAKMLKTVIELQYNLIGFDLITMYPPGNKPAKSLADASKRSSSSAELAEIMSQLNKLEKRQN